jgi:hypothetical protein
VGGLRDTSSAHMCVKRHYRVNMLLFWDITSCSPLKFDGTFRKNIPPPSSGSKNNPSKKPASRVLFSPDYTSLYTRRQYSPWTPLWEPQIVRIAVVSSEILALYCLEICEIIHLLLCEVLVSHRRKFVTIISVLRVITVQIPSSRRCTNANVQELARLFKLSCQIWLLTYASVKCLCWGFERLSIKC